METFVVASLEETAALATAFAKTLQGGEVFAFKGGMGVGKTTFTRALVQALGIDAWVQSPTFAILNEYAGTPLTVYHYDMFRIEDFDNLYSTGFFDYAGQPHTVTLVEWSENIAPWLPQNHGVIELEIIDENSRNITITPAKGAQ